ncbi:MAG: Flp pilus assembly protein CpaB [Selenomonadaceae bacterium]|nr:Flp pilus assembly protein CpaB [Selenomonadaceae bacterium]
MYQKIINKLNDLRPRQLLMLAGGMAIFMFAIVYFALSFISGKDVVETEEQKPVTTQVVVAKINIPSRTRIQESMLQLKEMPVDMVPEGSISSFKDILDVQVKVSIFAGDILTIQKVFAEKSDEGFIATIPLDCRAVSISVNDITSVAGFAKPGDFVDLLLVEKSQYSVTTNVLLQNVQLLSINKDMTGANVISDSGVTTTTAINNPSIATFALRPDDVLKLVSASRLGEIYMSLRPTKPRTTYSGSVEYTIESINTPPPEPEPEPVYRSAPAPVENPLPAIPSNPTPAMPLPQIPGGVPAVQAAPKIEIIQGDEITQQAETATVIMPAQTTLPAIPSGVEAPTASPPVVRGRSAQQANFSAITDTVSDTTLSHSRVAQSFPQ